MKLERNSITFMHVLCIAPQRHCTLFFNIKSSTTNTYSDKVQCKL